AGRGVASQNPLGYRNSTIYDAASRVVAGVNPLGYRTTMSYDAAGQRRRIQDANSRLTTSLYDAAGRSVATINTLGYRTTTIFDAASQTKALWDANGGRNTFTYDQAGRRTQWIDPLGRRTTSAYDAASNQTLRLDARGYRTTYLYDADQNVTGRKYGDGTRATFVYDSLGLRTRMENETGRYTTTYDELSQMRTVTSPPSFRITYSWDAVGQRAVMVAPTGGRFTYRYDGGGRIDRLINPEGDRTSYAYDAASRRTVKRLANGTRASFTYDAADNLTTLANMFPNGTYISKYDYKYDPAGNRYAVAEADGSRVTWLYDNLYQLTGENRTGTTPFRNTFSYDPLGNRLAKNESGTRTTYAYDAANQLKYGQDVSGRTTYTFDAAGNQAKEKTPAGTITTTVWNYENQPTLYKLPNATRVTIAYHPDLLRVQKDASVGTTNFIWDEQNYLAEADGSNIVATVYTSEPQQYGNLIATTTNGTNSYHIFDATNSTRFSTSESASIIGMWTYDAWGSEKASDPGSEGLLLWNGELGVVRDTNIAITYYIRHRVLSARLGIWSSTDPDFRDFTIASLYVYVANRPIALTDPSGREMPTPLYLQQCRYIPTDPCQSKADSMLPQLWMSDFGRLVDCAVKKGCLRSRTKVTAGSCFDSGRIGGYYQSIFGSGIKLCANSRQLCSGDFVKWWKIAMEEAYHAITICGAGAPYWLKRSDAYPPSGSLMRMGRRYFDNWLSEHWSRIAGPFGVMGISKKHNYNKLMTYVDCLLREMVAKFCAYHGGGSTVLGPAHNSCGNRDDIPVELEKELVNWIARYAPAECQRIRVDCGLTEVHELGDPTTGGIREE
ncbi:MAG: hypothetical protein NT069_10230, partial [Planctomycetota bacterium]|nr:hypothetical protein [Planctomycetota bacterium]